LGHIHRPAHAGRAVLVSVLAVAAAGCGGSGKSLVTTSGSSASGQESSTVATTSTTGTISLAAIKNGCCIFTPAEAHSLDPSVPSTGIADDNSAYPSCVYEDDNGEHETAFHVLSPQLTWAAYEAEVQMDVKDPASLQSKEFRTEPVTELGPDALGFWSNAELGGGAKGVAWSRGGLVFLVSAGDVGSGQPAANSDLTKVRAVAIKVNAALPS
jgi:hypothetical protein